MQSTTSRPASIPTIWSTVPVPDAALAEVVDPYLDPDTGLLLNLVGATTKSALAEAHLVWPRSAQLRQFSGLS
jgi:hypothetical protein